MPKRICRNPLDSDQSETCLASAHLVARLQAAITFAEPSPRKPAAKDASPDSEGEQTKGSNSKHKYGTET